MVLTFLRGCVAPDLRGHCEAFCSFLVHDLCMGLDKLLTLPKDQVLKVFNWWCFERSAAERLHSLPSVQEMATHCQKMHGLLFDHKAYLLETGLLPVSFPGPIWMQGAFRRICDTRITSGSLPESLKKPFNFLKNAVGTDGALSSKPVEYKNASFFRVLAESDVRFLEGFRPVLHGIALGLLGEIEGVLVGAGSLGDLFNVVFDQITLNMGPGHFTKLLEIESRFRKGLPAGDEFCFSSGVSVGGEGILNGLLAFVEQVAQILAFNLSKSQRKGLESILGFVDFDQIVDQPDLQAMLQFTDKSLLVQKERDLLFSRLDRWLQGVGSSDLVRLESKNINVFRRFRKGSKVGWELVFEGKRVEFDDVAGFYYIRVLLAHPGESFTRMCLDGYKTLLEAGSAPASDAGDLSKIGGLNVSTRDLSLRLSRLKKELVIPGLTAARKAEIEASIVMVNDDLVLKEEGRQDRKSINNKVGQAIRRVIEMLEREFPKIGEHLNQSIQLKSGDDTKYCPLDPSIIWLTENKD